jgi:hypothetical protein
MTVASSVRALHRLRRGAGPRRRRPFLALLRRMALVGVGLVVVLGGVSYGRALSAPGAATWPVRTVDWLRDRGLGPVINTVETWYYTQHPRATDPRG